MGIFDSVPFSPSGYGGLLGDILQRLQFQQPQESPGFADAIGNYGGVQYPIYGQPPQQAPAPQAPTPQAPTMELSAQARQQQPPETPNLLGSGMFANARPGTLFDFLGSITGQTKNPTQATYQALRSAGVPDGVAQAAAINPEVLKIIAPQLYSKPKFTQTGESPLGKQFGFVDEARGLVNGQPVGAGGPTGYSSSDFLAPGVRQEDTSLTGDAYLSQYSPQIQAAAKAYMNGDVMPSGNPRLAGLTQFAKTVAQKYGQDMGIPVSDSLYSERRKYRTELGSNYAGSAGGQAKAFIQGIEHASTLADTLDQLGNWNGFGIPFLAKGANIIREGVSTEQASIANKAQSIAQTLAGEVGKLFSGSQGGGVREREETIKRFSTVKSTPELAAALEATLEVMRGGLTALEGRRDQILGPNSGVNIIDDRTRKQMAHIEEVVAKLKSGQSPAAAPAPQTAINPRTGERLMVDPKTNQWVPYRQ